MPTLTDRDALIAQHRPLALSLAGRLRHLRDAVVDQDDVQSAALVGLTKAANQYDPKRGKFTSLAWTMIRGEIRQMLRSNAWAPRSVMARIKARPELAETLLRKVSLDSEPLPEMRDPQAVDPEARACSGMIRGALRYLRPREKLVVRLYFWDELTAAQIGARLGVSESRVHQLKDRALQRLRTTLAGREAEF